MVILSIRHRQNREALNEDLRANRKVFERQQQQVAIMPQSEMPPNDRLQMISYQFNKDVENVKNALNDGLTDMNTPDAVTRGFADFSSVSLSWNKLVARINPYLKGQQTAADVQPATAGDYAYVRQKLKDDLLQFFQNGLQQIAAFRQQTGGRVENFDTLQDIIQQLQVGFYKNVKYGSETRGTLGIQRLPANPAQGNLPPPPPPQGGPQGPQGNPPPQPQPAPQQGAVQLQDPQTFPQEAAFGNVNPQLLDRVLDPYQDDPQLDQANNRAREQELDGIHRRIATDINQYEGQTGNDINDPQVDPQDIIDAFPDDTRDEIQQFYGLQDDGEIDTFIAEIVDQLGIYRRQNAQQPQPQQGQQGGPARPTPPRGRPADENRKMAIAAAADRLGLRDALTGYAGKTKAEKGQVRQQLIAVANELFGGQATPQQIKSTKRYLEQMVGFGGNMNGGFLGELLFDGVTHLAKKALDTPIGSTLGSMLRNKVQDGVLNFFNKGRGRGDRSQPLRIANNFDGNQAYRPNTLADLKNRQRLSSRGNYVGDSTGAIIPNLQNRGVLGSARRMDRTRMEGEGVAEVLDAISRMGRSALENLLLPALRALGRAIVSGVQLGVEIPAHIRTIFETARGVYRREDVQTIFQYLKAHPDVLVGFLPKTYALPIIALRLIQSWFNLPDDRGRVALGDDYVNVGADGNGRGRCCFNSSMCNGTKAYRFKRGEKSANVRKESVRGGMNGSGNGVEINVKYSKLPKALQPTQEDLHPTSRNTGGVRRPRRPRLPQESYEGYQDEENDVYTHSGRFPESSPLLHSEMLQDKALGLLKGMPRRIGVEDPKFKPKSS